MHLIERNGAFRRTQDIYGYKVPQLKLYRKPTCLILEAREDQETDKLFCETLRSVTYVKIRVSRGAGMWFGYKNKLLGIYLPDPCPKMINFLDILPFKRLQLCWNWISENEKVTPFAKVFVNPAVAKHIRVDESSTRVVKEIIFVREWWSEKNHFSDPELRNIQDFINNWRDQKYGYSTQFSLKVLVLTARKDKRLVLATNGFIIIFRERLLPCKPVLKAERIM